MASVAISAGASLLGYGADLSLTWSAPSTPPRSLLLVRRRWGYPASADDGRVVLDLADLFADATAGTPWGRIDSSRYLLDNPRAEGGGAQAELVAFYAAPGDAQPAQVIVRIHPQAGGAPQTSRIASVTRLAASNGSNAGFGAVTTLSVFARPGGGAEALAGTVVISTQPVAAGPTTVVTDYTQTAQGSASPLTTSSQTASPNLFTWTSAAPGAAAITVPFSRQEQQTTTSAVRAAATLNVSFSTSLVEPAGQSNLPLAVADASLETPIAVTTAVAHGLTSGAWISIAGATGNTAANGTWSITVTTPTTFTLNGSTGNGIYTGGGVVRPPLLRAAEFTEAADAATQQIMRSLVVHDREPSTGNRDGRPFGLQADTVYYYGAFTGDGTGSPPSAAGNGSVLVTGSYGFADTLFALLPSVHRFYDHPASGYQGSWQLRRFMNVFGPALDHARSLAKALPTLYDPLEVRAEYLPYLADTIGWTIDRTLSTERQRGDLLFAPEVFATIGTAQNIQALASRGTGWVCQVKEFANNVFLTNAVEPVRLWQIFQSSRANPTSAFATAVPQPNIYPIAIEPAVSQFDPDRAEGRPAAALAADGTLWLFWHSTRLGSEWQASTNYASAPSPSVLAPSSVPGIYFECTRSGTSGAQAPVFPTTAGATVVDGSVLWTCRGIGQPRRRIWLQRVGVDPTPVNALADLADAPTLFDEAPAAARLGNGVVLAWASNRGGRNLIWIRLWANGTTAAGPARPLTAPGATAQQHADDRNPALAGAGTAAAPLFAFWDSTQSGRSAIWMSSSTDGGTSWSAPALVSQGLQYRMPAAVIDAANQVHLFWSAGSGVASFIRQAVLAGSSWTTSDVTDAVPGIYDKAPAAVLWSGSLWLFWHSNRFAATWQPATAYAIGMRVVPPGGNGFWYECTQAGTSGAAKPAFVSSENATVVDGTAVWICRGLLESSVMSKGNRIWSASGPAFGSPSQVLNSHANNSQPAAVVDQSSSLRLFLASQETGAWYRSRTFDTSVTPANGRTQLANVAAKSAMHTYQDRLHYTYDSRRTKEGMIALDAVGLYLTPTDGQSDARNLETTERMRAFLSAFRPVSTRLIYFLKQTGGAKFAPIAVDP